ncbi:MAG: hypothetical protein AABZ30_13965 [Myxococcota bacterium]
MRKWLLPALSTLLLLAGLGFLYQVLLSLARRDYVGAVLLTFVGLALLRVGSEMARWCLVTRP